MKTSKVEREGGNRYGVTLPVEEVEGWKDIANAVGIDRDGDSVDEDGMPLSDDQITHVVKTVDLDGMTIISNEDYDRLESLNMLHEDMFAPKHSEGDEFWLAAVESLVNYSDFDVDQYIADYEG